MIAAPSAMPIAATLTSEEAASRAWHAVVIGAGPAGAATALRLARGGWRVLLIDRHAMPRPKVCGCCLSRRALDELASLGLAGAGGLARSAIPLGQVRLVACGGAARLPFPGGGVLSRESLDPSLVEAAVAAGVQWLPEIEATTVTETADAAHPLDVACRVRQAESARLVIRAGTAVIAAGLVDHVRTPSSPPRDRAAGSRIGVGGLLGPTAVDLPHGELVMAVGRHGYCGIVRLEDGRIDLAAAIDRDAIAMSPSLNAAVAAILREADPRGMRLPLAPEAVMAASFRATPPLTHVAPLVSGARRRTFRVGDAAGYVEPFTGEGMGWALTSGRLLADALLADGDPAAAYVRAHATCFTRHHRRCGRVAAALRMPRLVGSAVRVAQAAPWMAARAVPLLIGSGRHRAGERTAS